MINNIVPIFTLFLALTPAAVAQPLYALPQTPEQKTTTVTEKPQEAPLTPTAADAEKTKPAVTQELTKAVKLDVFKKIHELAEVDLSVPASPAFAVLGVAPDKVQRPNRPRDFVGTLVRGLGPDGKIVKGLAVDISPASVFFRKMITGGTGYTVNETSTSDFGLHNWPKRVLARTTLSLGTTEGDTDGTAQAALGVRMGLIDNGDPGLYAGMVSSCISANENKMTTMRPGMTTDAPDTDKAALAANCDPLLQKGLALWAKPALYVGFGKSWYSKSGKISDRASATKALWATYSQGFVVRDVSGKVDENGYRTMLQAYLARRVNERATLPSDPSLLLQQDTNEGIIRLRTGKTEWHGYIEFGRKFVDHNGNLKEKLKVFALGAEFKLPLGDDTWLQVGSVNERGYLDGSEKTALTANIRLGSGFLNLPGPTGKQ